jgi:predicted anti-sigma-YlaC factor YlaD
MECKDLRELVVGHSSGDLAGDDRILVESHLSGCAECSELFSNSNEVWMLLGKWEEIEPRSDYISEFWNRVEKEEARAGFWSSIWNQGGRWKLAGALASVLIVGVFSLVIFTGDPGGKVLADRDAQDDMLLLELDSATSRDTTAALEIYGPWDGGIDVVNINGNGGFN